MSSQRLNKRFYKAVTVAEADNAWHILLDGMQLRTPGKLKLAVPSKTLAEAIANEWEAQAEVINPSYMPVTRLVNVAVEQTPTRRDDLVSEARRYAETDLVCYRAPQPRILKERQSQAWDQWLDWAAEQGVEFKITETLHVIEQPAQSLETIERFADSLNDFQLTLFVHLIAVFGSVVLAMAVMKKDLSAEDAFTISRVDIEYQIELWGADEEQADVTATLLTETVSLVGILEHL